MNIVRLKGKKRVLNVGENYPIIVNCNIGVNDMHNISYEMSMR